MPDSSPSIVCCVYPIKNGWKIIRGGVRVGLASSRESALNKIIRLSENWSVSYCVRIYNDDGSIETETMHFSPHVLAEQIAAGQTAFLESMVEESTQIPEASKLRPAGEVANTGVSMRERIALLAYSYWERRGRQGGSPEEDWLSAEREILRQI
jgi:hypothetical protein